MEDGREVLALFPLANDRPNWVAWTPEGVCAATPGARKVLRWHVNHGWDAPAEAIPVDEIPETRRPEVIRLVLQTLGTPGALAMAELAKITGAIQRRTGTTVAPGAMRLRATLVGPNVTVLTSSSATELSREDPQWGNGAFTEIVLEALSSRADANRNGLISVRELTGYLTRHVPGLTDGAQHPGVEMRFDGDVFAAGL